MQLFSVWSDLAPFLLHFSAIDIGEGRHVSTALSTKMGLMPCFSACVVHGLLLARAGRLLFDMFYLQNIIKTNFHTLLIEVGHHNQPLPRPRPPLPLPLPRPKVSVPCLCACRSACTVARATRVAALRIAYRTGTKAPSLMQF